MIYLLHFLGFGRRRNVFRSILISICDILWNEKEEKEKSSQKLCRNIRCFVWQVSASSALTIYA